MESLWRRKPWYVLAENGQGYNGWLQDSRRMPHVFISYVREDYDRVQKLANDLRAAGIDVWLDRERISPGENWRDAIRNAITNGAFFLACFSTNYVSRQKSYANEELLVAIEEIRKRAWGSKWFLPILLDPCEVPDIAISANLRLGDLQWISFYDKGWQKAISQIVTTINPAGRSQFVEHPKQQESATDARLTLLEELFLLCVHPQKAHNFDRYAFSAVSLAELILAGRVTVKSPSPDKFTATIFDPTPLDDYILDNALGKLSNAAARIGETRQADIGGDHALFNLCKYGDYLSQLVKKGILHIVKEGNWLRGPTIHVVPIRKQEELQAQFIRRVRDGHLGSDRNAIIAAIGSACEHSSSIPPDVWERAGMLAETTEVALLIKKLINHAKDVDKFRGDDGSWANAT